ncbi:2-amino-4-hydroxy-6-hydroxymethyldihydropteridinediphosphokinase [Shimia gijangensis]|uniref:2-amino-4-hydroxy-6-hydroxymethyldihydropteridine pyrophosphokinase n=1 Tax=Shimia gijangensis TaxID=1470563 RepID=A0A1M6BIL0_9RHOB|nr:2-amino-4-hydroxy-6-hydroxymethyldihydropteridine diphosphokinase [Shimia gijangensis]SHI48620.1 2-amino-4-hydroxy-6-hydroxymethyldihydropteridinediphosphokinase [Shimia gijangensis]
MGSEKVNNFWLLALGANLPSQVGKPENTLKAALKVLNSGQIRVTQVSRFFATPCFPEGAGPDFVNAAAVVVSDLPAEAVLNQLHQVEAVFGRERQSRWAGRTLDIDLLAANDAVLPDPKTFARWRDLDLETQKTEAPQELVLPHPRLQDRAFVLVPLMDVAPDWVHPVSGLSVAQMLSNLPEAEVKAVVSL